MTLLEHPILAGALKQVTASELAGPCPWCGGVDRFRALPAEGPTGRYFCRGCGRQGDGLAFLMEIEGVGYVEACRAFGVEPKQVNRTSQAGRVKWEPKPASSPDDAWMTAAGRFVDRCAAALSAGGLGLEYARGRGLTAKTCAALKIGWNDRDRYEDREAWGLPPDVSEKTGKPRRVWLPKGLVIPTLREGRVVAVKIRRSGWTPGDELPKYCAVTGSTQAPMVLAPGQGKPCVVAESELDAVLAAQEARDIVCAIALRTARAKPDAEAHKLLLAAPLILVATDADEAGATAWPWWRGTYPKAVRWPVPAGKDVGDCAATPGLIRAWIEAGLPDPVQNVEPEPRPETSPPAGKSSLRRADDLAHGEPCPYSPEQLARFALSHPHLRCCSNTTPRWWWVERTWCESNCKKPCEL